LRLPGWKADDASHASRASCPAAVTAKSRLSRSPSWEQGLQGATGPTGPEGPPGAGFDPIFAAVTAEGTPRPGYSRHLVSAERVGTGTYRLTYDRNLDGCVFTGNAGDPTLGAIGLLGDVTFGRSRSSRELLVSVTKDNDFFNNTFMVVVTCPPTP
jgi:hypothetical protein